MARWVLLALMSCSLVAPPSVSLARGAEVTSCKRKKKRKKRKKKKKTAAVAPQPAKSQKDLPPLATGAEGAVGETPAGTPPQPQAAPAPAPKPPKRAKRGKKRFRLKWGNALPDGSTKGDGDG